MVLPMADTFPRPDRSGTTDRVYRGIMVDLENGRMVPGQRLVETELAERFGVGRNAVREAMQRLAVRGVVDLTPNRSPSIRRFTREETRDVLAISRLMTEFAAGLAANHFVRESHGPLLDQAMTQLAHAHSEDEPGMFSRARRAFYRAILSIGGNRELQRLFPAIGMHIIYAQYQSRQLRDIRMQDYEAMAAAIAARDAVAARRSGASHVQRVQDIIAAMTRSEHSASPPDRPLVTHGDFGGNSDGKGLTE